MANVFSQPIVCPELVGRQEALDSLRAMLSSASEHGRVVLISGEAGIGKSRLLAELVRSAEASGWRALQMRFFEQDTDVPYSAVSRLLSAAVASSPEEVERLLAPFAADLRLIAPEVGELAGAAATSDAGQELDPEKDRRRIIDALAKAVRSLAADRPTLLAFEDVHWSETSSLEALLQIARAAAPGCLVILTYRSDEVSPALDAALAQLDRERLGAEVSLSRLNLAEVDRMLRAILGAERSTRADILHAVHHLTDGNPFFVEEVLRSFFDQAGSLESLESLDISAFDVPRSVNEAVRRRTQGLSKEASDVLSLASVAGARFDFPLLRELSGRSEDELLRLMKELIAAQLVVEEGEDRFAFRHALTREAIETMHAGDHESHVEDLAWHFYEAGEWAKALEYATKAGERAMALYAPTAALGHLTHAIEAGQRLSGAGLAELFRLRGSANDAIGDFEAAREDYEHAASDAQESGDLRTRWRALLDLGLLWASRDYGRVEPYYREALQLARQLGDPPALGRSLNRLGNWHSNVGDFDQARRLSEEALAICRAADDRAGVAETLDLLGMTGVMGGELAMSADYYRQAVPFLEELGDRRTLTSTLSTLPLTSGTLQTDMFSPAISYEEANDYAKKALEVARQTGSPSVEAYALSQLGFCVGAQGRFDTALAAASEGAGIARDIGHHQWLTCNECVLGAVYVELLNSKEAREHLENALRLAREAGYVMWLPQAASLLVRQYVLDRDLDLAAQLYESLPPSNPEKVSSMAEVFYHTGAAELAVARGEFERALATVAHLKAKVERPPEPAVRLARLEGLALVGLKRVDEGLARLAEGMAAAERRGLWTLAWRLQADLARSRWELGERDAAREMADRALATIARLATDISDEGLRSNFVERAAEQLPPSLRRRATRGHVDALTAREAEIAALVARGLTNREIADELVLSARTVETHVANAMSKMGFAHRSQLAAWAVERGLTTLP